MQPLSDDALHTLHVTRRQIGHGLDLAQSDLDRLSAEWSSQVQPASSDVAEQFAVARSDGTLTGAAGPRWLFHLFGIAHRASHVGLATPGGLIVLQRRSDTRLHWPSAWDMAVAGHVPQRDDGSPMSFEDGAWKEAGEELSLRREDAAAALREGGLAPIGSPYCSRDDEPHRNPPFHNVEVRQLFAATLTAEGLSLLVPGDEEAAGIYLCPVVEARRVLRDGPAASGLAGSLPRYLDWLARTTTPGFAGRQGNISGG